MSARSPCGAATTAAVVTSPISGCAVPVSVCGPIVRIAMLFLPRRILGRDQRPWPVAHHKRLIAVPVTTAEKIVAEHNPAPARRSVHVERLVEWDRCGHPKVCTGHGILVLPHIVRMVVARSLL